MRTCNSIYIYINVHLEYDIHKLSGLQTGSANDALGLRGALSASAATIGAQSGLTCLHVRVNNTAIYVVATLVTLNIIH